MKVSKTSVFLIFGLLLGQSANALPFPKCPTGNLDLHTQSELLHKVALLGDDGRRTLPELAAELELSPEQIERDLSGIGAFWCAGARYTAQLTGSMDVITTAAHAFYLDDCRPVVTNGRPCQFQPANSRDLYDVHIDWNNLENPTNPRDAKIKCPRDHEDWAVLKLKKAVTNAQYLNVGERDVSTPRDREIIQLATKANLHNRTVDSLAQRCSARKRGTLKNWSSVILHDCDTEPGASGGAQVTYDKDQKKFFIFGVHKGGESQLDSSSGAGSTKFKDFDGNKNANISVPVGGQFLAEIKRMIQLGAQPD